MAMGTVIKKTLGDGEQILVDGNSILCFESSVTVDVRPIGSIAAMCCGGEGLFNTELTGEFHFISLRCIVSQMKNKMMQIVYLIYSLTSIHPFFRFLSSYLGPGTVFLQSMSIDKLRALFPPQTAAGGGDGGGGE